MIETDQRPVSCIHDDHALFHGVATCCNMLLRTSTLFCTYHYDTARLRDVLDFALGLAGRPPSFA